MGNDMVSGLISEDGKRGPLSASPVEGCSEPTFPSACILFDPFCHAHDEPSYCCLSEKSGCHKLLERTPFEIKPVMAVNVNYLDRLAFEVSRTRM